MRTILSSAGLVTGLVLVGGLFARQLHAATPFVAPSVSKSTNTGLEDSSSRPDPRSHVLLSWNADEAIFPLAKKFAMSATPLSDGERERALQTVSRALQRYPVTLLQQNLKAVFVVGVLRFRGVTAAGTYGADRVYIGDRGEQLGYTKEYMTEVFHDEFSSVLLWRHHDLFNDDAWKACNPPDFSYGTDGVDSIKRGTASPRPSAAWWKKGFIDQYSTSSVEEDFNAVVGYLFATTPGNRPALTASKTLQRKAALVEKFYSKLGMDINSPDGIARHEAK